MTLLGQSKESEDEIIESADAVTRHLEESLALVRQLSEWRPTDRVVESDAEDD